MSRPMIEMLALTPNKSVLKLWWIFTEEKSEWIVAGCSPYIMQNVIITSSGAWKLGGFGFAVSIDNTAADTTNAQAFHYAVSGNLCAFVNLALL